MKTKEQIKLTLKSEKTEFERKIEVIDAQILSIQREIDALKKVRDLYLEIIDKMTDVDDEL